MILIAMQGLYGRQNMFDIPLTMRHYGLEHILSSRFILRWQRSMHVHVYVSKNLFVLV